MPSSTLTSKGQITLPRAVRERLGLKQGDRLEFSVDGEHIVLQPARVGPATHVAGLLKHLRRRRAISVEAMRSAVRRRARARAVGSRRA